MSACRRRPPARRARRRTGRGVRPRPDATVKVEEPKKKRGFWGRVFGRGDDENERKKEEERKKKEEERLKAGVRPPGDSPE